MGAVMRYASLTCAACLLVLGTAQNAIAADADVIRNFGVLGRQAIDCSAPYSESNPHVIYAITATGNVTRTLRMGPDSTRTIRNLRMVGPNVLQFDETARASDLTISVIKQSDGKIRSWMCVRTSGPKKGEVLFKDGKQRDGSDTIAFTFCGK